MRKFFYLFFLFFLATKTRAQLTELEFQDLSKRKKQLTYQDLAHKYQGCPENSECNQFAAEDLKRWKTALKKGKGSQYSRKHGVLARVMGSHRGVENFNAVLWNSPCEQHNKRQDTIFMVDTFIKSSTSKKIVVWSNGKEHTVQRGELLWTDPIYLLTADKKVQSYFGPRGERPLYLKNKKMVFLINNDKALYQMTISQKGQWAVGPNTAIPAEALQAKKKLSCPPELEKLSANHPQSKVYRASYCEHIWDQSAKQYLVAKRFWTCH